MLNVKIVLEEGTSLPVKANHNDACYDVIAVSRTITPNYIEYGLGFKTEIPDGYEGDIRPRSSISKYDLVMCNSIATMDAGYRGEWKVRFKILPPATLLYFHDFIGSSEEEIEEAIDNWSPTVYNIGDKVAQISFRKVGQSSLIPVGSLEESTRGEGGFGSSGR